MLSFPRPVLVRLVRIDGELRSKRWPNASTLARLLEVTERTIHRDIDCLRDQLGAPIEYDSSRHGYYYREESYRLALPQVTEGECLALFLAERLLQQYRGTPLAADLERLFHKITVLLPQAISLHPDLLAQAYSIRTQPTESGQADCFRRLIRAVRDGRQLELLYWTASRDVTNRRLVDPYHLAAVDGDWFLIGYCHLREEPRMFAPARIRELRETGERCQRPDDFRIADFLDVSFRRVRGTGPTQEVRLRFSPVAARYIRERIWHPTQQLHEQPDGKLVLTLRVNHLVEVKRWALSWGADCEVLGPEELREEIGRELQTMMQQLGREAAAHEAV